MPECVRELLFNIQKNPHKYIGEKSLESLTMFLFGYLHCLFEREENMENFLAGFQEFVQARYEISSAHGWSQIIRFFSATEAEAFDTFYELLCEYYHF